MKKNFTMIALLLAGMAAPAIHAQDATRFNCVADTWIRQTSPNSNNSAAKTLELGQDDIKQGDEVIGKGLRGVLYGFEFNLPAGQKVDKATLHFVSERNKGGKLHLYSYQDFAETANWNSENEFFTNLIENGTPLVSFDVMGEYNKTIQETTDETKLNVAAWSYDLDVTECVKSLGNSASRVNFLIYGDGNNNNRFYSKENDGQADAFKLTDAKTNIPAADLMPYLEVVFVEDSSTSVTSILPVADTQIRKGNKDNKATAETIEIKTTASGDEFYGLMRFELPSELFDTDKYELKSADLRISFTQCKGDRAMGIYDYTNDFAENTVFENEADYVEAAKASQPIVTFDAAGYGSYSITDNKAAATNMKNYTTGESWSNHLDLTEYINGKVAENATSFNILIKKQKEHNDAMKVATKEIKDQTNDADQIADLDAFTIPAKDLVPQLTITFEKKMPEVNLGNDDTVQSENTSANQYDLEIIVVEEQEEVYVYVPVAETAKVYYKVEYSSEPAARRAAAEGYSEAEWDAENAAHKMTIAHSNPTGTIGTLSFYYEDGNFTSPEVSKSFRVITGYPTGIEAIEAETNAAIEYFDMQGRRVLNPEKGVYIMREGNKVTKVVK